MCWLFVDMVSGDQAVENLGHLTAFFLLGQTLHSNQNEGKNRETQRKEERMRLWGKVEGGED